MKKCSKCQVEQPLDQFVKSDNYKDGKYPICKTCRKATRAAGLLKKTLCTTCGVNPHAINSPYCEPCQRIARGRDPVPKYHRQPNGSTTCPRCGVNPKLPDYGYCRQCKRDYLNEWVKSMGGSWQAATPEQKAKTIVRQYIGNRHRRGLRDREPCLICGDPNTVFHHLDYLPKTLNVIDVCILHHHEIHKLKKEGLTDAEAVAYLLQQSRE